MPRKSKKSLAIEEEEATTSAASSTVAASASHSSSSSNEMDTSMNESDLVVPADDENDDSSRPSRKSKETAKRVIHNAIQSKLEKESGADTMMAQDDDDAEAPTSENKEEEELSHAPRISIAAMKRKQKAEKLAKKRQQLKKKKKSKKDHESSDEEDASDHHDDDEEEHDEEEADDSDAKPKKKSSSKKREKKKTASKKKEKKKSSSKKRKKKDEDDESDDHDHSDSKKKKKKKKTTKKSTTKKKKIKPGMREIPDEEVLDRISQMKDEAFTEMSDDLHTEVSPVRTSKEIFRAILTKNYVLLKKILEDEKNVNNIWISRSVDCDWTVWDYAIRSNDQKALDMLFEEATKYRSRVSQSHSIETMSTGHVGKRTFGRAIRSVNVSRGGREGIDVAFAKDSEHYNFSRWNDGFSEALERSLSCPDITTDTIDYLIVKKGLGIFGEDGIYNAVQSGNLKIAIHLAKKLQAQDGFGLNLLHVESLELDGTTNFSEYKSVSVVKKALAKDATPVHFAAINPNTKYLKELVENNSDGVAVQDAFQKRPLHFAACSSTPDNIKYLLEKGANIIEKDSQKRTALHYAAKYGHAHNVEVLCPKDQKYGAIKDKFGYTPLHLASWYGHADVCEKLVECGVSVDVAAKLKETPLMSACKRGHLHVMKKLIEKGAKIEKLCSRKKSLLMYAAMNGHFEICRYLLKQGADPNHKDSAGNSVMHYAVAYGWFDIVKLLLVAGGDLHALNSWKYSPLNISMLKSHYGITEFILNDAGVDLNLKDSEGCTLIHKLMSRLNDQNVNQIKYLIETKKDRIDLTITDAKKQSLFHYITGSRTKYDIELAKLFIKHGLHYDSIDASGVTPLMKAFNHSNINMIKFLLEQGSRVRCKKHEENILHLVLKQVNHRDLNKLFGIIYENMVTHKRVYQENALSMMNDEVDQQHNDDIVTTINHNNESFHSTTSETDIKDSEQLFYKMAQTIDATGKTPLMAMIEQFSKSSNMYELAEDSDGEATPYPTPSAANSEANNPFNVLFGQHDDENHGKETKKKLSKKKSKKMNDDSDDEEMEDSEDDMMEDEEIVPKKKKTSKKKKKPSRRDENSDEEMEDESSNPSDLSSEEEEEGAATDASFLSNTSGSGGFTFGSSSTAAAISSTSGSFMFGSSSTAVVGGSSSLFGTSASTPFASTTTTTTTFASTTTTTTTTTTTQEVELDSDGEPYDYTYGYARKKPKTPTGSNTSLFLQFLDKYLTLTKTSLKHEKIVHITEASKIKIKDPNTNKMRTKYYPPNQYISYTPLHFAVKYRNAELIKVYLSHKYRLDVNAKDFKGITPLHLAVQAAKSSDDAIHLVKYLLKHGAELNSRDSYGRTPFFYAFTDIPYQGTSSSQNYYSYGSYSSSNDPIELVSDMCNFEGLEMDIVDHMSRSPLHYAALRGATISSIFLIQRGAELNRKDEDGNTVTNLALLSSKVDFVVTLINKGGDVHAPIYSGSVDPLTIREQKRRALVEEGKKKKKSHLLGVRSSSLKRYDEDDEDEDEDESEQEEEEEEEQPQFDSDSSFEEEEDQAAENNLSYHAIHEKVASEALPSMTMFKYALSKSFMGLAYLIMQEPNIKPTQVISDALDTKQYGLVQKLIRKTRNDLLIHDLNSDGQNVMHLVARHCGYHSEWNMTWSVTITKMLLRRHVNVNLVDTCKGRTPLHYACKNRNDQIVSLLLKHGALPNTLDTKYKRSALIHACKNSSETTTLGVMYSSPSPVQTIVKDLLAHHANPNIQETKYGRSALHFAVCLRDRRVVQQLCQSQSINVNLQDVPLKRTPLHHAVLQTDNECVNILLNDAQKGINVNSKDMDERTPLHYAVGINLFGYHQNVSLVESLMKAKADIHVQDKDSKSPLYYSYRQTNGIYTKLLLGKSHSSNTELEQQAQNEIKSLIEYMSTFPVPHQNVSFESDASEALRIFEENEANREETEEEKKERIPKMDKNCALKNCQVLQDDSLTDEDSQSTAATLNGEARYFHAVLNKTDVKYGTNGYNNFYILQIGHNVGQNLYVLFNRYGRVGETGMFQTTPFQDKDEAIAEFKKIFKSKTGNEWGKEFEEKTKKYKIVDVSKRKVKDPLQPIDLSKAASSTLPEPIYELMKVVCDITILRKDLTRLGISDEYFSLGQLSKERLKKGYEVLTTILQTIKDRDANPTMPPSELLVILGKLADLSNEFYSLIPHHGCVNCPIESLESESDVVSKMKSLEDLIELRTAARILLASQLNIKTMNPLDYTYHALGAQLAPLAKTDEEFSVINRYMDQTGGSSVKIMNIFRVNRQGESDRFDQFLSNQKSKGKNIHRMLLWHGSPVTNFLSILSKGLLIAPKEAPVSGYMFGKGIYCADMFGKSLGYCRSDVSEGQALLLLCEVLIGNPYRTYESEYMEEAKSGFDSTMGVGARGPNSEQPFVQYDGVHIPLGPVVDTPKPVEKTNANRYWNFPLHYNEYIVYNVDQVRIRYMVQVKTL
ncbi:hypothetical protein C9374_010426 [Naegleria lovaniensis]|uniref:Poly [ADP-ribose] polymerase n=1 Tax=Naegleria lovaniensis TaxID=51637 RepID=A0AA88GFK1_NAELO|nr:uncharacterized protein C9374_010426 [Naegleria lovaniensis]KAG2374682.1 hypothetical protein C9374_010426 [Naegleria lovaniensis]